MVERVCVIEIVLPHIEVDEVGHDALVARVHVEHDEMVANDYLYWDIQVDVIIAYLDDVSMNAIDTASIALQVIEL